MFHGFRKRLFLCAVFCFLVIVHYLLAHLFLMRIDFAFFIFQEQFLDIFLVDVTDPRKPFYINDKLVEEGYAEYPDKVNNTSKSDTSISIVRKMLNNIHKSKH